MAVYERIEKAQDGSSLYKNVTENKVVDAEALPAALKEELDIAAPGTKIDDETITQGEGDGVVGKGAEGTEEKGSDGSEDKGTDNASEKPATPQASNSGAVAAQRAAQKAANKTKAATKDEEEEAQANQYSRSTPQSTPGMGFPRKNGKTVDFFDGETPHTHIRAVAGFAVPLSAKNYNEKTDTQIYEKLVSDGYINE